jgi:hypothetical protein
MPILYRVMPKRHEAVTTIALMDVSPRAVALTYSKHRSMLELDEFFKLAMSISGMAARTSSDPSGQASLGDPAEETPRNARKPIEFRHWARLVLSEGDLNLIEPGDGQIAYVTAVVEPGCALGKNGIPQSECDPLKLLLDGHPLGGAPAWAARIRRQTVLADPIQARKVLQRQVLHGSEGMLRMQGDDLRL